MKTSKRSLFSLIGILIAASLHAQGTFENLNFEMASPGPISFSTGIAVSNALPYWTVTIGGVQQTDVGYNAFATGASSVSLIGPGGPTPAIDGNYSVLLQGSYSSGVAISQMGAIPSGTESLLFEAQPGYGNLIVSIGTQTVPTTAIGSGPNYTLYAANLSAWANDIEQITFSAAQDTTGPNNWIIDDISFSTEPVPEPSVLGLTAIGGLVFGARKWLAQRR